MNKQQSGFTLIELIMVIVILGILAATALPRFVDLSTDAADAALQGVAGAAASGSAINFATCAARGNADADCSNVNSCDAVEVVTVDVTWDDGCGTGAGYDIDDLAVADAPASAGDAFQCTITDCSGNASGALTFTAVGGGF